MMRRKQRKARLAETDDDDDGDDDDNNNNSDGGDEMRNTKFQCDTTEQQVYACESKENWNRYGARPKWTRHTHRSRVEEGAPILKEYHDAEASNDHNECQLDTQSLNGFYSHKSSYPVGNLIEGAKIVNGNPDVEASNCHNDCQLETHPLDRHSCNCSTRNLVEGVAVLNKNSDVEIRDFETHSLDGYSSSLIAAEYIPYATTADYARPGTSMEEPEEKSREVPTINVKYAKSIKIFDCGPNEHGSQQPLLSPSASECIDIKARVAEQTYNHFQKYATREPGVETDIVKAIKEKLKRKEKYQLVILCGRGVGCNFAVTKVASELSSSDPHTKKYLLINPEEALVLDELKAKREHSITNNTEAHTAMSEEAFCNQEPQTNSKCCKSIVIILDASGTAICDTQKLEDWFTKLKHNLLYYTRPEGSMTILMTLQKWCNVDYKQINGKYNDFFIDASDKRYQFSDDTKQQLVRDFARQYHVKITTSKREEAIYKDRQGDKCISLETIQSIINESENLEFTQRLKEFFEQHLEDGAEYFCKPTQNLVQGIREFPQPEFITLVAIYAHRGVINMGTMCETKSLNPRQIGNVYRSLSEGMDKLHNLVKCKRLSSESIDTDEALKALHEIANKEGASIISMIAKSASSLDGKYIKEINNCIKFSGKAVENSLLIVLCERNPEILMCCKDAFFFNYVRSFCNTEVDRKEIYFPIGDADSQIKPFFMERIRREVVLRNVCKVMHHPIMKEPWFFPQLLAFLKQKKHRLWEFLSNTDSDSKKPYCPLYFGIDVQYSYTLDPFAPANATEDILKSHIWTEKRKKSRWKQWAIEQETAAILHAIECHSLNTFQLFIRIGVPLTLDLLLKAIDVHCLTIVEYIMKTDKFLGKDLNVALLRSFEQVVADVHSEEVRMIFTVLLAMAERSEMHVAGLGSSSLIHSAARIGNTEILKLLLDSPIFRSKLDRIKNNETALLIAVKNKSYQFVDMLLQNTSNQRLVVAGNQLPIFHAASSGDVHMLQILVQCNPDIILEKDCLSGNSIPLHFAVKNGHLEAVQYLLSAAAEQLHYRDNNGQSALHIATHYGQHHIVSNLIRSGANLHMRDNSQNTALSIACNSKQYIIIEQLLKAANCSPGNCQDNGILIRAVRSNDVYLVQLLLENGYILNVTNSDNGPPIFAAIDIASNSSLDMLKFLLKNNADTNITDNGYFPVHRTCSNDNCDALVLLLTCGASLLTKHTVTLDTLLHMATRLRNAKFLNSLLSTVDCTILKGMYNADGETALDIASKHGYAEIIQLLDEQVISSLESLPLVNYELDESVKL